MLAQGSACSKETIKPDLNNDQNASVAPKEKKNTRQKSSFALNLKNLAVRKASRNEEAPARGEVKIFCRNSVIIILFFLIAVGFEFIESIFLALSVTAFSDFLTFHHNVYFFPNIFS